MRFPEMKTFTEDTRIEGKDAGLKVLEESAELVEAIKDYLKLPPSDDPEDYAAFGDFLDARMHILEEFGDVLQTLANVADVFGLSEADIQEGYDDVVEKNTARGKHRYAN